MLEQLELTHAHLEALNLLEKSTGKSRDTLISRALDSLLEQSDYDAWADAKIQRGLADVAAGRVVPHEEAMARISARLQAEFPE